MPCHVQIGFTGHNSACVTALHSSLSSGRQWATLVEALGGAYHAITPDLFGHGDNRATFDGPTTLAQEAEFLGEQIDRIDEPIHLVGHSYGGAVAFKIATDSPWSTRIRSLTLIEPVLPTVLLDDVIARDLHGDFARLRDEVCQDIGNARSCAALDRFLEFWKGSAPLQPLSDNMRARMTEKIEKLAPNNFACLLSEENVAGAAAALSIPTLLMCGGLSPNMSQQIVARLSSTIAKSEVKHVPTAGHMLPVTHAGIVNASIIAHIARADVHPR